MRPFIAPLICYVWLFFIQTDVALQHLELGPVFFY